MSNLGIANGGISEIFSIIYLVFCALYTPQRFINVSSLNIIFELNLLDLLMYSKQPASFKNLQKTTLSLVYFLLNKGLTTLLKAFFSQFVFFI